MSYLEQLNLPDQPLLWAVRQGYLRYVVEREVDQPPYELRLELDGILICWILPGELQAGQWALPSEDQPLDLLRQEDAWDYGTYLPIPCPEGSHERALREQLREGDAQLRFEGEHLRGNWRLRRTRNIWWLQRQSDGEAE